MVLGDDVEQKVGSDTAPAFRRDEAEDPAMEATSAQPAGEAEDAPQKVVKICKKCMVSQSGGGAYCVNCGSELVPIRAVRESYVGEIVGGKYKIVDRLGAGGMGEVYLGLNEPLGQRVAVKFLSKRFTADEGIIMRFLNEARSYCKVNHPNAVTLLEYGQHDDGALYLITEFIEGESLTETLKEVGPFAPDQVVSVSTQICEVLSAAHRQGVIHRDLKPDNIMLMPTSRGRYAVKVLDFGIAKIVDDDHDRGPMTETGSVFGTPEFMSPEQARGDTADPRSDLYAVGVILFYLATGKLPFKGKNKLVVLNKQLNERPIRPSEARADIDVPLRLEAVILKCLNKEPDERYQSADDLLEALEEVRGAPGASAPVPGDTERLGARSSEVSDTAANTPSKPHRTDAPGVHDSETKHYDFAGEFFTDPEEPGAVDLGEIDHADDPAGGLDDVDLAGEWADRDEASAYQAPGGPWKFIAVGLVVLLAGVGVVWSLQGDPGDHPGAADPPAGPAVQAASHPDIDIDHVLVTGQVLGSLSAAEDSMRHADFASAKRALDSTYLWMSDDELPAKARQKRTALRAKIDRLGELDTKFNAAIGGRDCSRARRLAHTMAGIETSLKTTLDDHLAACASPSAKPAPAHHDASPPKPEPPAHAAPSHTAPAAHHPPKHVAQPDHHTTKPVDDSKKSSSTGSNPTKSGDEHSDGALPPKKL